MVPGPAGAAPFLYRSVAAELRRRIQAGQYGPGEPIPTEAALVREFGVSAITVRRAVRELMTEGLVFGRQGIGVFVADTRRIVRSFTGVFTTSMAEDMQRSGYQPSAKERSLSVVPASAEVAARMHLPPGTRVYRHEKIILADDHPIGVDTTFLPARIGDVVRHALADDFIVRVLLRHDFAVDHMDYRFEGGVLSADGAAPLGLPTGFPVLSVTYTAFDRRADCVFTGCTMARSDRVSYEFCGMPDRHPRKRR